MPLRHAAASFSVCGVAWPLTESAKATQALGGVGAAVEQDVLDELEQVLRDLFVDRELAGVDDAHRQAGVDGVVEKRGVHRLAHGLVAAERERDVADAAGGVRERELLLAARGRLR